MTLPLAVLLVGCVYTTPRVHSPQALAAGEITVANTDAAIAEAVRGEARSLLNRVHGAGPRATIDVHVVLDGDIDYLTCLYPCWPATDDLARVYVILGAPFGFMQGESRVSVDVVVHTADGRLLAGHGEGDKYGSRYVPARRRALAVALDHALAVSGR